MRKKIVGIYAIKNNINGKVYIGQSVDIFFRWSRHRKALKENTHLNSHLQYAYNKYGENNFSYLILKECTIQELNALEDYYIKFYKNHYNLKEAGSKGHHSEETKRKMSKSKQGYKPVRYKDTNEKTSIILKNLWKDEEYRNHMKLAHSKGKIICVETNEIFECVNDASKKLKICHIWRVLNKENRTAGGYHWRYYYE